jgi:signal transduction histidine kinase
MPVDSDKIKQVFINLLQNALEAMPQGGNLNIASRICLNNGQPGFTSEAMAQTKVMEIKVTDTGCGMDQSVLANAFEPFYTSKREGLGLGLPICKEIVEGHQGAIEIESQKNQGTTFTIKLPIRS